MPNFSICSTSVAMTAAMRHEGQPLPLPLELWLKVQEFLPQSLIIATFCNTFVMTNGIVYGCGDNVYGQLGNGNNDAQNRLVAMQMQHLPRGITAKQIAVGNNHTVVLGSNDQVYACGDNESGELGNGNNFKQNQLVPMQGLPHGVIAKQIAVGRNHTVVLGGNGQVYACGGNYQGKLGNGNNFNQNRLVPMQGLPHGVIVKQIAVGRNHTVVLGSNGQIYACGDNVYGQLGNGNDNNQNRLVAMQMQHLPPAVTAKQIAVGQGDNTIVLASNGQVYACGNNQYSLLGNKDALGVLQSQLVPMQGLPPAVTAKQIAMGDNHTVVLGSNDQVYACGNNQCRQLGLGYTNRDTKDQLVPMQGLPPAVTAKQIAVGRNHTVVLGSNGQVYACGSNSYGELASGNSYIQDKLVPMQGLPPAVTAKQIAVGVGFTVVLGSDGQVYACGKNEDWQLGNGNDDNQNRLVPMQI